VTTVVAGVDDAVGAFVGGSDTSTVVASGSVVVEACGSDGVVSAVVCGGVVVITPFPHAQHAIVASTPFTEYAAIVDSRSAPHPLPNEPSAWHH
jgi:hypothetical protein